MRDPDEFAVFNPLHKDPSPPHIVALISVLIPVLLLAGITKSIEDIMSRIEIDKLVSRRLIAVNLGPVKQTSALQLSAAISKAICRIFTSEAENGVSVVYVPHDYKDDVKSGEAFVEVLR